MNFFNKLIKRDSGLQYKNWDTDLLSSEALKRYFLSKEAIHAYCSDVGIVIKRDIALEVESVLVAFLEYEYNDEELSFIDGLLKRNKKIIQKVKNQDKGLYNRLKDLDNNGVLLLGIDENIDSQKLKSLYRKASMKYHPDKGGSVDKMQQINEAFTLFHDAILNYFPINGESGATFRENSPVSISDWKFTCYLVLSCLQGDFFAADRSFKSLKSSYELNKEASDEYVGTFSSSLMGMGGVLDRCCRALGRMDMAEELKEAASITSHYVDLYIKYWKPVDEYDCKPSRNDYPSKRDYESELGTKIVINHPEQAKNAFRLGKIDEMRFQKTMKKYEVRENESLEKAADLKSFYKSIYPQIELTKSDYKLSVVNPKIIAPISYFQDRYDFLDENQKWEYINSLSLNLDSKALIKYIEIRVSEIILGLIKNYDRIDKSKLKVELSYFEKNFAGGRTAYSGTLELLEHLEDLGDKDRIKKLNLLTDIDENEPKSFLIVIDLNFSHPQNGYLKRIEANDDYIEFAQMAYEQVLRYKSTGEFNNHFSDSWNKDLKALKMFNETDISKKREKFWLGSKKVTPEEVIDSSKPYIEGLLKLGKTFHKKHTGELQVGYDINRLTTAYAKLKKWEEVVYWAELFFNLPKNYRDRSSEGEQEKIKKRLQRTIKELG